MDKSRLLFFGPGVRPPAEVIAAAKRGECIVVACENDPDLALVGRVLARFVDAHMSSVPQEVA